MIPGQDTLDKLVAAIDCQIRRWKGIWEFSDDPQCILRLELTTARQEMRLADGTVVHPGEPIVHTHMWNERMPQIPPGGPDLVWARTFRQSFTHSFSLMARHAVENPALAKISAFGGEFPHVYGQGSIRMFQRLGVEVCDPIRPQGVWGHIKDLGVRLWAWLLRRAFNPESARGLRLRDIERRCVWFSRQRLLDMYGPKTAA